MKLFLILILGVSMVFSFGCQKKQDTLADAQIPLSIDMIPTSNITDLSSLSGISANLTIPKVPVNETISASDVKQQPVLKEVQIPQGPYRPSNQDIQRALKAAGYYSGPVDGIMGPKSKKAVEEFQKANNLQVDGKVGPKTWAILSAYLKESQAKTKNKNL